MNKAHHLMLIDDDEDDREIFLSVIQNILPDITYSIAINGQDALSKLNGNLLPHLIFLDLNMPVMNGRQFLAAKRQSNIIDTIPVVVLSTSSDKSTIREAMELGALHFITKPDKFSAWEGALRDALNKFLFQ